MPDTSVNCGLHFALDKVFSDGLESLMALERGTIYNFINRKAIGVPSRPRLFEARQAIRLYEAQHRCKIDYIVATPQMALYEKVSAQIYSIYLKYVGTPDIHVYSIDEVFIEATHYMQLYQPAAEKEQMTTPHYLVMTMIRDVLKQTGITATAGIGTNLYLAKVAMDIVAKKAPADRDGVRIAELDEQSYRLFLWSHAYLVKGQYKTITGMVLKVDPHEQTITVRSGADTEVIPFSDVYRIFAPTG